MQIKHSSGTPYTLTDHFDPVVFGTTSPEVTIPVTQLGVVKVLRARAVIDISNVVLTGPVTITFGLRRTSGTPADLGWSLTAVTIGAIGTSGTSEHDIIVDLPPVSYTVSEDAPDTLKLVACVRPGDADGPHGSLTSGTTEISDGAITIREASIMVENPD